MENKYVVNRAPHIKSSNSTSKIMLDVIISMIPIVVFGVYNFGLYSLIVIITSVVCCVFFEYIFNLLLKKENTINDLSAVVTGLILALNLPPKISLYIVILGAFFAIIVVKELFGGLGQNFMNPALGARCFLLISFTSQMNNFVCDTYSSATPLTFIKNGQDYNIVNNMLGFIPGTIGEVSKIAILIGVIYLLIRKVIKLKLPLTYILTTIIFIYIFASNKDLKFILGHLMSGGLIFGAFYMATDYVTSPITDIGKVVYGIILGILTGAMRVFGSTNEGVSFAIIIGNLLVPIIDNIFIGKAFGLEKKNEIK